MSIRCVVSVATNVATKKPPTEFQLSYLPSEPIDPESDEFQKAYEEAIKFVEADDISQWLGEE